MKKSIALVVCLVCFLFTAAGCSAVSGGGTPPVLTVDGIDITIGESRPYDLTSQGFETSFAGNYMVIGGEMPGNSWLSNLLVTKKEDTTYAYLYVYNPDKEAKMYSLANIYKVQFNMYSEDESYWAENNILVNGVDYYGLTSDEVKEKMQDYKLARETESGSLRYDDGSYKYYFDFDDSGVVENISIELEIPKGYSEM